MRVVVLGGAGDMGSFAVRDLMKQKDVEELTIGDYDEVKGKKLAAELGKKCKFIRVDANDHEALVEVIKGFEVAVGAIGPFYKNEVNVARAAIEAGGSYVSICVAYDAPPVLL